MPFWPAQLDLGPSAIHLHLKYVDEAEVFQAVKGRACLIAGVDHAELLQTGTPEAVESKVKEILKLWGDAPGLILGPGCEMGYKTPLENIRRFKESAVRFSTKA
jgi:uroporphyrinogen-III decarboxylase